VLQGTHLRSLAALVRTATCVLVVLAPPTLAPATTPELVPALGHSREIAALAFTRDGHLVFTGGFDGEGILWDGDTGVELKRFRGHAQPITSAVLAPEADRAVTSSADGSCRLWSLESGKEIARYRTFSSTARVVGFAGEGSAVVVFDRESGVTSSWQLDSGAISWSHRHSGKPWAADLSSDGTTLVTGGVDPDGAPWVEVFDAATGERTDILRPDSARGVVFDVHASHDASELLVATSDGSLGLWDLETGTRGERWMVDRWGKFTDDLRALWHDLDAGYFLTALALTPSPVVVTNTNRFVTLWTPESGESEVGLEDTRSLGGVKALGVTADGTRVLVGGSSGAVQVWDRRSATISTQLRSHALGLSSLAAAADLTTIAVGTDRGLVRVWTTGASGTEPTVAEYRHPPPYQFLKSGMEPRSRPISEVLLEPSGGSLLSAATDARLIDLGTGEATRRYGSVFDSVSAADISPWGHLLATGEKDGMASVWSLDSGELLCRYRGHREKTNNEIRDLRFSRDGLWIATAAKDAHIWEAATCEPLVVSDSLEFVRAVDFSITGGLWTALKDGTVTFREPNGTEHSLVPPGYERGSDANVGYNFLAAVRESPDGSTLIAGVGAGKVWMWRAGESDRPKQLIGHTSWVTGIAYSAGSQRALTASLDGTVRIWDLHSGDSLCTLINFEDGGWAVVDPKGRYDSSNLGDVSGLHWVIGLEPIGLSQLKRHHYVPGLLGKVLRGEGLPEVPDLADIGLHPAIELSAPAEGTSQLGVRLTNRGGDLGRVQVFVNGKELTADARGEGFDSEAASADFRVDLTQAAGVMPGEENEIRVVPWSAAGDIAGRGAVVAWRAPGVKDTEPEDLWVIVGGVSDYDGDRIDLRYAADDAARFADAVEVGGSRLFGEDRVHVILLADLDDPGARAPTAENFRLAFEEVRHNARPKDLFVTFLAGHGVGLPEVEGDNAGDLRGTYAYLTADADTIDPQSMRDLAHVNRIALTDTAMADWFNRIPALKRVLILDTCAAGAATAGLALRSAAADSRRVAIARLRDRTGYHVLLGSGDDRASYEANKYQQGLLTYALLEGMRGEALREQEFVDVSRLFQYAADRVPALARGVGAAQHPEVAAPDGTSFDLGQLLPEDREKIRLAVPVPVVLRPQVAQLGTFDRLMLGDLLHRELKTRVLESQERKIEYTDDPTHPGLLKPWVTYVEEGDQLVVVVELVRDGEAETTLDLTGSPTDLDSLARDLATAIIDAASALPAE